jgi:formate/nitrite transporter FocA (FNT family)
MNSLTIVSAMIAAVAIGLALFVHFTTKDRKPKHDH